MRRYLAPILLMICPAPLLGQQADPEPVHEMERLRGGFGELRPPRDSDQTSPRAANFDEAKTGEPVIPPLFDSPGEALSPQAWEARRSELINLIEDNWFGQIPDEVSTFRIVWSKEASPPENPGNPEEQWIGQVVTRDGRMGPVIDARLTFPSNSDNAPSIIEYSYIWPPGFRFPGPPQPDTRQMALKRGYVHIAYRVQLLQADTAALMKDGVIGLARWPRDRHDWGALRAWAWGASELRRELSADRRINPKRISLAGHSRFGKAVLVAAAFDHEFADALVSSSGAGGAKLMRRDFGESWTNMAGSYAYHWYTPQVMEYAGNQPLSALPVDAHMLIALRAPQPMFISSGLSEKGDAWVDPKGMWIATSLAQPAWKVYGMPIPQGTAMPPVMQGDTHFPLAFFQHDQGHVMWPAFTRFLEHAERFASTPQP